MDADRPDHDQPPIPPGDPDQPPKQRPAGSGGDQLGKTLRGSLPCIGCGYELQGLSVRSPCPECGILVRATILHSVDPHAHEFQPLTAPKLSAWGLAMWPAFGLLAVLIAWIPRIIDFANELLGLHWNKPEWLALACLLAVAISAIGAVALLKPSQACPRRNIYAATIGLLAYIPIIWTLALLWRFPMRTPYINAPPDTDRLILRLILAASLLVMLFALRPNARRLVARCLALRTGRVQRQTILATAAAIALAAVGDLFLLASIPTSSDALDLIGKLTVLMGSILMTAGLMGATIDAWRIRGAILAPAPTMKTLFHHDPHANDDHHRDPHDDPAPNADEHPGSLPG